MVDGLQHVVHLWVVSFGSFMAPTLLIAALAAMAFYLLPHFLVQRPVDDPLVPSPLMSEAPWLVLAGGLLLTLMAWTVVRHTGQRDAAAQFEREVNGLQTAVNARLQSFEDVLRNTEDFFSTQRVDPSLWQVYFNSLHLDQKLHVVYSLGYATFVEQDKIGSFRASIRAAGERDFTVFPLSDRPDYFPIVYAEPASRNAGIVGFDLGSDAAIRAAAEQARQTGAPTLTPRVTLLDDPEHRSLLYFLPVPAHATVRGWVFLRVRQEDFLKDLVPTDLINLQAFDDAVMTQKALFFDSSGFAANWRKHGSGAFSKTIGVAAGGRHWTLHFTARPAFAEAYGAGRASVAFGLGLLISLAGFGVVWAFASSRRRAFAWAQKMTSELRMRQTALTAGPHGLLITDSTEPDQPIVYVNARFAEITGYSVAETVGKNPRFLQGDDHDQKGLQELRNALRDQRDCRVLLRNYRKDGTPFWNDLAVSPIRNDGQRVVQWSAVVQDVTEREQSERRLTTQVGVIRALSESRTPLEASARLLEAVCEGQDWELGAFWNLDAKANVLRCMDIWHQPDTRVPEFELLSRQTTYPREMGLPGYVWARGEPVWIGNMVKDANFPEASLLAKEGLKSACGFPIASRRGLQGVLTFYSRKIWPLNKNLLLLMVGTGTQMSHYIERQELEAQQKELTVLERGMAEFMGEGLVAMDREGICIYANASAQKILGYPGQMLLTQNLHEALHPSNIGRRTCDAASCPIARSLQNTETHTQREPQPLWRRDKSIVDVTYMTAPIIDHALIQGVVITFVEASSPALPDNPLLEVLREKEAELARVKQALEEKTQLLLSSVQASAPPVIDLPAPETAPVRLRTVLLVEEDSALCLSVANALREHAFRVFATPHANEAVTIGEKQGSEIDVVVTDVFLSHTTGKALIERIRPFCPDLKVLYVSAYSSEAIADLPVFESPMNFLKRPFDAPALVKKLEEMLA